jgi:hypothetical protein
MQINEITATIIIMISILITTSGIDTLSSLVFAQNDSETDLGNMTLTNSSENLVDISGLESPQQQPQGPIPPAPEQQPQGPLSPPTVSEQPQPQPLPPLQQSPSEQPSGEPTIR